MARLSNVALLLLVVPAAAAASPIGVRSAGGSLELLLTTKDVPGQRELTFSPLLRADAVSGSGFGIAAEWGVAATRLTSGDNHSLGRVAAGNPAVTIFRDLANVTGVPLRVGLGVVIGVGLPSGLEEGRAARDALAYAAAARGLWNAWDWLPVGFGLVVPLTLDELRIGDLWLSADGALAWASRSARATAPAGSGGRDLFAQLGVNGAAHLDPATLGVRLQVVGFDTGSPSHAEVAVAPFAAVDLGPIDLGARALFPLAGPTNDVASWSLQLAVAGRL